MLFVFSSIHQASSQSEDLNVLNNYSWYFDNIGGLHVVGEVQNVGPSILNPVVLGGTIYTQDSAQLSSNPCIVYVNYMLPQQKAPFLMDFMQLDMSLLSQGIEHIEFTVIEAKSNSSHQYPNLAITSSSMSTDSTGACWVSGEVQNTGDKTATNVRVIGTFYNDANGVVAVGYSEVLIPNLIHPSSSASFKVGAFDVNMTETTPDRQISSYTLLVQAQGPLLEGTPPPSTSHSSSNSSSSSPPSSPDSPSNEDTSNSAPIDYLRLASIVALVAVAIGIIIVYNKRKTSKASKEITTKHQPAIKRRQPTNRRYLAFLIKKRRNTTGRFSFGFTH